MNYQKSIGTLGEIMPEELTRNSDGTCRIQENSINNFLENELIKEKVNIDKTVITEQKRIIKKPFKNVFMREKGVNGMVQEYTNLTIWRENKLKEYAEQIPKGSSIELIIKELQSSLKGVKSITNRSISKHMQKKYNHLAAFKGTLEKVEKYVVQMNSKLVNALAVDPKSTPDQIDNPLIIVGKEPIGKSQYYQITDRFHEFTPATLNAVVYDMIRLKSAERKAFVKASNSEETNHKTIPESIAKPIKTDPKKETAPEPIHANNKSVVATLISQCNMPDIINKIIDNKGSIKINADTFEINLQGE